MKKKGVSPLIATVIVVGAVIVIAGLLFMFMRETIIKNIDKAGAENEGGRKCLSIEPSIMNCKIKGSRSVVAKVKNDGSESIVQWIIRAEGDYKGKQKMESINRAGEIGAKKERTIGGTFKQVSLEPPVNVEFIPVVSADGIGFYCNEKIIRALCTS